MTKIFYWHLIELSPLKTKLVKIRSLIADKEIIRNQ